MPGRYMFLNVLEIGNIQYEVPIIFLTFSIIFLPDAYQRKTEIGIFFLRNYFPAMLSVAFGNTALHLTLPLIFV
jgi:hypothetical protein